jgi:hypothetical protein
VDADEVPGQPVVGHEWGRLFVVELDPLADRLRSVVCTAFLLRAAGQPLEHDLVGHLELEDDGQRAADLGQHRVEGLRLRHRPREAVEDEALLDRLQLLADQLDHQIVRDEVAALEDRLDAPAELAPRTDRAAENVPGRDVREPVLVGDALRLRALARALDAEEKDVQRSVSAYFRKPS